MVTVTINGQTIEIEREVWDVLMQAINRLVDSGDIALLDDRITRGLLARAKMASGALHLAHGYRVGQAEATEERQQ